MRATTSTAAGDEVARVSGEGVARRLPTGERLGECVAGLELSADGWSSLPKALPGTASGGLLSGWGESSSALATGVQRSATRRARVRAAGQALWPLMWCVVAASSSARQ